ncbi:hypothetical protein C8R43DRAFT_989117 [Mycena crocata]|nr:hypothetical protein C8R43DRAFT_989117 [Mycena crocata]
MSLFSLGEYLLFLVCLELPLADIGSLRQVCRILYYATRTKALWINVLERKIRDEGAVLPPYLKTYDSLDASALEALVRRVSQLADKWQSGNLAPVNVRRLDLPQSITWLRLVSGSWLFVASSDNHSSKISCWNLSFVSQGSKKPLAEAYLPGQVKTGKVEVQDCGIVLALGLQCAEALSVHIITLRQRSGQQVFSELYRNEESSHVLMLSGKIIGCALRHGAIVPHIINWEDNVIFDVPLPPGDSDIPERRSAPHLMTIWGDLLVIVRKSELELYTLPGDFIVFSRLIKTPTIWEATVCSSTSPSSDHIPPLRLIVISTDGVRMCVVEHDILIVNEECRSVSLAQPSQPTKNEEPWYQLCVGGTGRSLWISESQEQYWGAPPDFIYMDAPSLSSDTDLPSRIVWSDEEPDQLAVWAFPVVDFDDTLGLTVVGNCFGELAIYDHAGGQLEHCVRLARDFTDQPTLLQCSLPTAPIPLGLSVAPRPMVRYSDPNPSLISSWVKDDIDLTQSAQGWSRDWVSGYPGYLDWDMWQGAPSDFAWRLEHVFGFPGPVFPQAYAEDDVYDCQYLLFRSGNRYFVFTVDPDRGLRSWPLGESGFSVYSAEPQPYTRRTANTVCSMYKVMRSRERHGTTTSGRPRNRWIEQAERGGRPHKNLLITVE